MAERIKDEKKENKSTLIWWHLIFKSFASMALTSLSNGPLFAQFTADLIFAAIADSLKVEFNEA